MSRGRGYPRSPVLHFPFLVLATLNSAGYRYGASDQAFYVPAVLERLDPALFPRDSALIRSQAKLTLVDERWRRSRGRTGLALPVAVRGLLRVTRSRCWRGGAIGIGGATVTARAGPSRRCSRR